MFHDAQNVPRSRKNLKKKFDFTDFPAILSLMKNNKLEIGSLKNGHLYFHLFANRVERITKVHSFGIVEHRHHSEKKVSSTADFRLATREEVLAYLGK
jgi:uncharacterized protein YajQ (UPF0234 family)